MTSKSKAKGNGFEREVVEIIQSSCGRSNFLAGRRAWGSNGQSLGQHEEVDVLLDVNSIPGSLIKSIKLQCKRKAKLPEWLGMTEHVDAVVIREDRGEMYILLPFKKYLELL